MKYEHVERGAGPGASRSAKASWIEIGTGQFLHHPVFVEVCEGLVD
ncbi:hypothetical protein CLOSTASPAR_01485 [[Clostridium] asparagiforme DSM 15981]|uniref:Uncharacterized protein n=1 Tax=[Clostridium] asparagiforme DSM 15981 TaxID=518636 RepID=C0CWW4_9FIRM|nr:hypothetical protein CLOSTASPAR_01485 [[Clostridium] asparagiforme DSM 15981]